MGYCVWADTNERNKIYHDGEWGVPVHDDRKMFEHLMLECMQCGLSWDLTRKTLRRWGRIAWSGKSGLVTFFHYRIFRGKCIDVVQVAQ